MSFWAWPKCHFLHQFLDLASVSNIHWRGSQWLCICLHRCKSCYHITACRGVASPGLQIFGCWGELKSLRAVSVGEWTSHACNFQEVWKWKSARPTTSLKAGYAPGLEYNVEWFISVISHVWLSNPPPPPKCSFFQLGKPLHWPFCLRSSFPHIPKALFEIEIVASIRTLLLLTPILFFLFGASYWFKTINWVLL